MSERRRFKMKNSKRGSESMKLRKIRDSELKRPSLSSRQLDSQMLRDGELSFWFSMNEIEMSLREIKRGAAF